MLGFRVWDIGRKEFCYEWFMDQYANVGDIESARWNPLKFHEKYIPMQSTGIRSQGLLIKDRNYDFIYEGDIVKIEYPDINHEYIFLVESIPQFYCNLPGKNIQFLITILGNKFENPELLERLNAGI